MKHQDDTEDLSDEQKPLTEQSLSDKLQTETPVSPTTPGVQKAGSAEIKNETKPNTE